MTVNIWKSKTECDCESGGPNLEKTTTSLLMSVHSRPLLLNELKWNKIRSNWSSTENEINLVFAGEVEIAIRESAKNENYFKARFGSTTTKNHEKYRMGN